MEDVHGEQASEWTALANRPKPRREQQRDDYDLLEMYGSRFKVIRLKSQLTGDQVLAATYRAQSYDGSTPVGDPFQVGGQDVVEADGVTRKFMKLLRPPASVIRPVES